MKRLACFVNFYFYHQAFFDAAPLPCNYLISLPFSGEANYIKDR